MPRSRFLFTVLVLAGVQGFHRSGAQEPPRPAANVILVTLDGFRPQEFFGGAQDALLDKRGGGVADVEGLRGRFGVGSPEQRRLALLPFLWGTVARQGQVFGDRSRGAATRLTNGKKFSYPGYNELFCGRADDRIDSNAPTPNPNLSVFEYLDGRPPFRGKVAVFGTWDVFGAIVRADQNRLKVHVGWRPIDDPPLTDRQRAANFLMERLPHLWPDNVFDVITMEAAREHLVRHTPRVLFIGLGETDEWAHSRRYDLYLQAAYQADRYLADLWATVQSLPTHRDSTALIVTTDHGRGATRIDWTDHGQRVDDAEHLWIALIGPSIPARGVRDHVETTQSQVAATIARVVGEDFASISPQAAPSLPFAESR